ncbi:MAG: four-carbon acid sugar kinase family protein [Paracoccaceae bacterium]|nr:four-carbon acid sugar kinase family protein [Paracoccaceae bacterium]
MQIGAVADDITGATDLCLMLSRSGLRTIQLIGLPAPGAPLPAADAVVIALKSRTIPAAEAVALSTAAAELLRAGGARQILFKYCSTFDSTDRGNIGPVVEALLALTGSDLTIACPAFPAAGRTVFKGHLFVGDRLLSESPLRDHPLTPMRDPDLVRVLQRQTVLPVGKVEISTIRQGVTAVRAALGEAQAAGVRIVVTDTLEDSDLLVLGRAVADLPLVTGGSGIGLGLAANVTSGGAFASARMATPAGRSAILAGSCSAATRGQIAALEAAGWPARAIDVEAALAGRETAAELIAWIIAQPEGAAPLLYTSAAPEQLAVLQARYGREALGAFLERLLSEVGCGIVASGVRRLIVAGGETAGAVLAALGVTALEIGPEIAPGVPWTRSLGEPNLVLALKSGNFGDADFFLTAWSLLAEGSDV